MTGDQRRDLIEDLVGSAPKGLGLAAAARRNIEKLNDAELLDLKAKVTKVREHSARVRAAMQDTSEAESAEAARRKELYARLKRVGTKTPDRPDFEVRRGTSVLAIEMKAARRGRGPLVDPEHLLSLVGNRVPLPSSVSFWNSYETHRNEDLTDRLHRVVLTWLLEFEKVTFDHNVERSFASALFENPALKAELTDYFELALDRLGRDTLRIVRNHLEHNRPENLASAMDNGMLYWLMADKALSSTSFDLAFYSNPKRVLPNAQAMEGLAKMRVFAKDYEADAIVSMAGGGKMVGDFLAGSRKLPESRCMVMMRHGARLRFAKGSGKSLQGVKRILLVDDVVGRGDDLLRAYSKLAALDIGAEIQIIALAGTAEGRGSLMHEHSSAFVTNVTVDDTIDLPWSRDGVYRLSGGNHTFAAGGERPWSIRNQQLNQLGSDLTLAD